MIKKYFYFENNIKKILYKFSTLKAEKINIYYHNNKMYFTIYDNYNNTIHILKYEKDKIKNHLKFTGQKSSKIIDLNNDNKLDFMIINENQLTSYSLK